MASGEGRDVALAELRVPKALRPRVAAVLEVTDAFCAAHLDAEYAGLVRALVGRLGRKRPSPLVRGDVRIWAAGALHRVGSINFLFDPSESPHLRVDELAKLLDVSAATMTNKSRMIRDLLGLSDFDSELCRRDLIDRLPWFHNLAGFLIEVGQ